MQTEFELKHLSDTEILAAVDRLRSAECVTQAQFLVYINIIQARELFAGEGYSSLHKYLMARFHYSKSSALRRMHAAGLARKFPLAYTLLAEGKLSLSHLQVLAPKMTVENAERLFAKAVKQSVEQLEESLAEEFARPEAPDKLDPLGDDRFKFQFTADGKFLDKLRQGQALLGKKYPSGRLAHIFEEALDLLLKYEGDKQCRPVPTPAQEKFGLTQEDLETQERSFQQFADPGLKETPRYIRRRIRREVWERDGGCCAFRRKDGSRCGETRFLEFDHIISWALGGRSDSASNIQLLCRAHNQWKARQEFGRPYLREAV